MSLHVKIQAMKPQPAAVVEFVAPINQISGHMGQAFGEVMAYLSTADISPAGPPFSAYPDPHPDTNHNWRIITGFPVSQTIKGNDKIKSYELPGGDEVAVVTHIGPYDTLKHTYAALQKWAKNHGHQTAGIMWETYLDGPDKELDPSKWRTDIYWPVK